MSPSLTGGAPEKMLRRTFNRIERLTLIKESIQGNQEHRKQSIKEVVT